MPHPPPPPPSQHYHTVLSLGGRKVAVVGAHLVANPNDPQRCASREAQAVVLRGLIDELRGEG
jgi:hypothetical protein